MNSRTAIITGANTGLGLECARALLASDPSWHVVLAVRDPVRGADAVTELGQPARCTVAELDLGSLRSVQGFVTHVRAAQLPPLHAVVCNAGVQVVSGTVSAMAAMAAAARWSGENGAGHRLHAGIAHHRVKRRRLRGAGRASRSPGRKKVEFGDGAPGGLTEFGDGVGAGRPGRARQGRRATRIGRRQGAGARPAEPGVRGGELIAVLEFTSPPTGVGWGRDSLKEPPIHALNVGAIGLEVLGEEDAVGQRGGDGWSSATTRWAFAGGASSGISGGSHGESRRWPVADPANDLGDRRVVAALERQDEQRAGGNRGVVPAMRGHVRERAVTGLRRESPRRIARRHAPWPRPARLPSSRSASRWSSAADHMPCGCR